MTTVPELIERIRKDSPEALGKLNDKAVLKLLRTTFAAIARDIEQAPDGAYTFVGLGTFRVRTVEAQEGGKGGGRRVLYRAPRPKVAGAAKKDKAGAGAVGE
jgi:nucleoid DNA-binding protein